MSRPPKIRISALRRKAHERTYAEWAAHFNCSVKTVKNVCYIHDISCKDSVRKLAKQNSKNFNWIF